MSNQEEKKRKLLEKHRPLTPKDIEKLREGKKKAKEKYAIDSAIVERNLTEYLAVKDPIIWKGKAIAWVRRPTMKELKDLIPKDIGPFLDDPNSVPEEKVKEYDSVLFGKMEELIVIPKKTAKQWEEIANPWFLRLFFSHIMNIAKVMEMQTEGF